MSKGDSRRPGSILPGAWDAIFGQKPDDIGLDMKTESTDDRNVSMNEKYLNTSNGKNHE